MLYKKALTEKYIFSKLKKNYPLVANYVNILHSPH